MCVRREIYCVAAKAINTPPGEYDRKVKTQMNDLGPAQEGACGLIGRYAQNLTNTRHAHDSIRVFGSAGRNTGAAWLSSARVVRCWVKSRNSATLTFSCYHLVGHSAELPVISWRKVGMTSSPHGPYVLPHCYNGIYNRKQNGDVKQILKRYLSSMHSATRVHEAGITSNRGSACHGECVPGSGNTARHTMGVAPP